MPPVNHPLLRDRRDELDLSNADIAKMIEQSPRYTENIINGWDDPSGRVIHKLARALDLPVEKIRLDNPKPTGDPSDPPVQPTKGPSAPPGRGGGKRGDKGPKRAQSRSAA